ncbi:Cadherin domain-containing protein [Thiothrix caldifontis]|uniref:Cadherin domain-containing protein n=1 Tax=Thiothrix caldifontis TaxID=525918 RepID=A0A1H3VKP9_9GAMM|nr:cadherin domain-containing protein [Thiothrix caldifontis]SDZ75329.1 Cadherin domain-containing protein [Thiothrix caldifontis]
MQGSFQQQAITHRKSRLTSLILSATLALAVSPTVLAGSCEGAGGSGGRQFWLGVLGNYNNDGVIHLNLVGKEGTTGTLSSKDGSWSLDYTIPASGFFETDLPNSFQVSGDGVILNNGLKITGNNDVSAYIINEQTYTTDGFLGYPTNALGNEYYVIGYNGFDATVPSRGVIVASQDNTSVTVTKPGGAPANITLNEGQVYSFENGANDITGSHVLSDKPVSVFGGAACANVPVGVTSCDTLVEQMLSVKDWGVEYVVPPIPYGQMLRVVAAEAGTEVYRDGVLVATLGAGGIWTGSATNNDTVHRFTTNGKKIQVVQYAVGAQFSGTTDVDPAMGIVPSREIWLSRHIFKAQPNFANTLLIVSPTANTGELKINGAAPATAPTWTSVPNSDLSWTKIVVDAGAMYTISSNVEIGITVFGGKAYESYMLPGNMGLGDFDLDAIRDPVDCDADGDGILNSIEKANALPSTNGDSDGDGRVDELDLDSDNDGIPDNIEAQTTAGYIVPSGTLGASGLDTAYGTGLTPVDTDSDGIPDYLDQDSDDAGTSDTIEAGITLTGSDADNDGLDDSVDADDNIYGPNNAGIIDVLNAYPKNGSEVNWRILGNHAPVISTGSSGDTYTVNVPEGKANTELDYAATDTDGETEGAGLTWSLSGTDAALFTIDPNTGVISFKAAPSWGTPQDAGANNVYDVIVTVTDATGEIDQQTLAMTVTEVDTDGDGIGNSKDNDIDGDGIPNATEGTADADNDNIANQYDLDSDGDGIPDNIEAQTTAGYIPPSGTVSANGVDTAYGAGLTPVNTDGTDTADYLDTDSDNSGANDTDEAKLTLANADADGDGLDNAIDTDDASFGSANAGITDVLATYPKVGTQVNWRAVNTAPVIPNSAAIDYVENTTAPAVDLAATDDTDTEGDKLVYSITGGDDTALFDFDTVTGVLTFKTTPSFAAPTDTDGNNTYLVEVAATDSEGVVTKKMLTITVLKDTDGDSIGDKNDLDSDNDGILNSVEGTADTDSDGIANQFDLDSDGDGIPDNLEAQTTAGFTAPSGVDADKNGLDDAYGTGLIPINTDGTDTPDYLDTDADNSGNNDTSEAGITLTGADADNDGLDDGIDSDDAGFGSANAGITDVLATYPDNGTDVYWRLVNAAPVIPNPAAIDYVEKTTAPAVDLAATDDTDTEGDKLVYSMTGGDDMALFAIDPATGELTFKATPSFAAPTDTDGNNTYLVEVAATDVEGVVTKKLLTITVLKDTDHDGVGDKNDLDLDGDGILNSVEGIVDTDGDGIQNQWDLDSDGDGIPDNIEAQTTATFAAPSGVDADKNGVDDAYGASLTPVDTESDSKPDYIDNDAENTGGDDNTESDVPVLSGVDADGDGLDDVIDTDDANFGPANAGITDVLAAYPKTGDEVNWRVPNTPPVFESPAATTFDENATGVVLNVEVSDDKNTEAALGIGYSIVGSDDDARFTIDPKTGGISFKLTPDYEAPADKNKDNAYTLTVKACDSEGGCSEQTIVINVVDVDEDNDGDGLMDSKEAELGTDRWEPDTDGDGLNDGEEVNTLNTNPLKSDTDGDSLSDSDEVNKSKTDPLKADTDDDGVNDGTEVGADPAVPADTDADSTADAFDTDDDNDGTPTAEELPDANGDLNPDDARNTDGDLLPDYLDNDDDGDGVLSQYEDPAGKRDSDKDGIVDTLDADDDNDGLLTEYEQADPNKDGNPADQRDTDKDGIADWLDTDDDGDGVLTMYEMADKDGNGNPTDATDTDADGKFNWLDVDDDNDGILTKYEKPDADGDGNPTDALDTDTDSKPNYLDSDDDGDSKLTADEKADKNKDGNPIDAYDADADGIPSYLDPNEIPTVVLHVRGFLQGAYSTADGLMRDDLRKQGLIPAVQPYTNAVTSLGYTGTESLAPSLLTLDDANAPVDWVVVELRSKTSPKTVVARAAAILQRDGDVADPQTNEAKLLIPNVVEDQYYVSLRHRNHLGITTQDAMLLSPTLTAVDFTLTSQTVMGNYPRLLGKDAALMWAGEANNSDSVIANGPGNDTNVVLGTVLMHPTNLLTNSNFRLKGYYVTDLNLDGISLYSGPSNDINLLLGNVLLHPGNGLMAANYMMLGAIPK